MKSYPLDWSLQKRLDYAISRAEKTINKHPAIAEIWLKDIDNLQLQIANLEKSVVDNQL